MKRCEYLEESAPYEQSTNIPGRLGIQEVEIVPEMELSISQPVTLGSLRHHLTVKPCRMTLRPTELRVRRSTTRAAAASNTQSINFEADQLLPADGHDTEFLRRSTNSTQCKVRPASQHELIEYK